MSSAWQRYTDGKLFLAQWHHDRAMECVDGLARRAHDEAADALLGQAWRGLLNELLDRAGQKARVDSLAALEAFFDPVPPQIAVLEQARQQPDGWVALLLGRLQQASEPLQNVQGIDDASGLLASDRLTPHQARDQIFTGFRGYLSALRSTWQEF